MKKETKIMIVIIVCTIFLICIGVVFTLGYILVHGKMAREQIKEQEEEIEAFFEDYGYDIDIIGAHTNGRSMEGPFSHGWYWSCFDIGKENIMLYHYNSESEIEDYLYNMDQEVRNRCNISEDFVFYYNGYDENIISVIKEFCSNY